MKEPAEILEMAKECLNCKVPLCSKKGCPVNTKIPEFIAKIKENNIEEAYNILQENNSMSDICGLVCPTEKQCKGKCIKGIKGEPVRINELESFVNNWAEANNVKYKIKCEEKNNIKIAVIGSGPAGIACSIELAKKGFSVTVFEKEEKIGGVLRYGIPDFRLEKSRVDKLETKIKEIGIEIKTNTTFGKDITKESLNNEGYKAIFIGMGNAKSSTYKLSENSNKNIYKADEFLKEYGKETKQEELGTVVVIGGGNVAIDSARSSIRRGAKKVYIIYRRDEEAMPARKIEIEEALEDGIEIIYLTKVISAIYEGDKLKEIECIKTKMEKGNPIEIKGSNYIIKADNVIFAIGIFPDKEFLEKQGIVFDRALIEINENGMTNIEGVFAGGDVVEAKSSVCRAIKMGKDVANNIEKYLA